MYRGDMFLLTGCLMQPATSSNHYGNLIPIIPVRNSVLGRSVMQPRNRELVSMQPPRRRQRSKRSLKKRDRAVSIFIAIIPPHSNCQILASCPSVEFIRAVSKLKKLKESENLRLVFTSLVKRRKRKFNVLVVCTETAN